MKNGFLVALLALGASVAAADDRAMFGVAGDVVHLEIENSDDDGIAFVLTVDFDAEGNIVGVNDVRPDIRRDTQGRIVTLTIADEDEEGVPLAVTTTLEYDENGHVSRTTTTGDEGSWDYTYEYDPATGMVTRRTYSSMGESERFTYMYTDVRDANGNWVSRVETADGAEFPLTQTLRLTYR